MTMETVNGPILKLEASAGSGKTFRLTLEFLTRLLRLFRSRGEWGNDPAEIRRRLGSILAITFTNKAAGEMKERIIANLRHFALATSGQPLPESARVMLDRLIGETGMPAEQIFELADRLLVQILSHYDDFHVRTIDSLMSAVIQVISPDLGLPADYRIRIDASADLAAAVTGFLQEQIDRDWTGIEAFLRDWSTLVAIDIWRPEREIFKVLERLFRLSLSHDEPIDEGYPAGETGIETAHAALVHALGKLRRLVWPAALKNGPPVDGRRLGSRQQEKVDRFLAAGHYPPFDPLLILCKHAPTDYVKKGCPEAEAAAVAAAVNEVQGRIDDYVRASSRQRLIRFPRFFKLFQAYWNRDRTTVFVEEFSKTIHDRIRSWEESAYPYLYLKLSDRFLHFLFDEFQDTSELQFKALAPIIEEVLASQKTATLFIVGDRKQAIYRWRGGNSRLMDEEVLRAAIPALDRITPAPFSRSLPENRRSAREIVEFVNAFWDPEKLETWLEGDELIRIATGNFAHVRQIPAATPVTPGMVLLSLQREASRDLSAEEEEEPIEPPTRWDHLLPHIGLCRRKGYPYASITILLRKNEQCRDLLAFLTDRDIPAVSDESLLLATHPLTAEILAFFRFIDSPTDDLSFFTFITGIIFRELLRDRFPDEAAALDDPLLFAGRSHQPFYKIFQSRCPAPWEELLTPFFRSSGFLPPYDLFADMTMVFDLFGRFPDAAPFFIRFADLLHHQEREHLHSLAAFLERWAEMETGNRSPAIDLPTGRDAVRIMTIHQAKGLEFPVVILPLLSSRGRSRSPIHLVDGVLHWINRDFSTGSPVLRELFEGHLVEEAIDELNLLYVAMTRARTGLIISGPARPSPNGRDKVMHSLPQTGALFLRHPLLAAGEGDDDLCLRWGELPERDQPETLTWTPADQPITSKGIATLHWQSDFLVFRSRPQAEAQSGSAARGDAVHRILCQLPQVEDAAALRRELARLAAVEPLIGNGIDGLADRLSRPPLIDLFTAPDQVFTEREICGMENGSTILRRIDRLQVGAEVRVIEWKTGPTQSPLHRKQVQTYLETLEPLFPGRPRRGLLVYLDQNEIIEVTC